jgi:hypothetical protein
MCEKSMWAVGHAMFDLPRVSYIHQLVMDTHSSTNSKNVQKLGELPLALVFEARNLSAVVSGGCLWSLVL